MKPGYALVLPWDTHHVGGVNNVAATLYRLLDQGAVYRPYFLISSWERVKLVTGVDTQGRRTIWTRIRVPLDGNHAGLKKTLSYLLCCAGEMRRALRVARQYRLTIINFHYVTEIAFTWALLRRLDFYRGALVLSFHGTDLHNLIGKTGLARWLAGWMLNQADSLVMLSEEMSQRLQTNFQVKAARVHIVPSGVDPETIRQAIVSRDEAGISAQGVATSSEPLIVSLGSFDHVKGHDVLLSAFAKLRQRRSNIRLLIAGRPGGELEATRASVVKLGIEDCVQLVTDAVHDRAMRLLNQGQIFVLPSRREGLPMAILEAGVLGKAVIVTMVGGVPELVRDRQDGILVRAEDVDALCDGMESLLADPDLAAAFGQSLRLRVLENFTVESMITGYLRAVGIR